MKCEIKFQTLRGKRIRMSEFKRQHPVAAITNVLKSLREFIIPIVIVYFLGGDGGSESNGPFSGPYFITGILLFVLTGGIISWWRYLYKVEDDEIKVEYGLFIRKKSYIPRHRIQVINISSGVIQRIFGLVSLNVQTAGGSTPGVTINALTKTEATRIKESLSRDDTESEPSSENLTTSQYSVPEYALSAKNLLIAGSTAGSFGIALSIVGTIMSQMQYVVEDNAIVNFLEQFIYSDITFFAILIVAMIFFAWVLSIVGTVLSYANFKVFRKKKEILISRGLFEKKQISIPYSRIQAIRIKEGILRQPFGYCTIYVDSAGYGEQSGQSTILFPLLMKSQAWEFIRVMVPEYDEYVEKNRPPKRALRRYILRAMIPILLLTGITYWFTELGIYTLILLPLGALLGYLRFRVASIGSNENTIIIRYRNLAKTTAIVKRHRIQSISAWDNWFQRRRQLKSITMNIASSDTGASFTAKDFEEDIALDLIEWTEPGYLQKQRQRKDELHSNSDSPKTDWLDPGF